MLSVFSQDYDEVEYIIIDGASKDGTVDTITTIKEKYTEKNIIVVSEKDDGIYDAMNKGILLAKGEVIGFLNGDDIYNNNYVLKKVADVFTTPEIDACYADLVYVAKNNLNKIIRYWKSCKYKQGLFLKGWAPPHPTFFVRKKVYERYGGFDLNYSMGNDVELMMRFLSKYKIKSVYIPQILIRMRVGGVSNRNIAKIIEQNLEMMRAGKKNNIKIIFPIYIINKIITRISQYLSKPSVKIVS